jgi:hypothetical protein
MGKWLEMLYSWYIRAVPPLDMTSTAGEANADINSEYNAFGHDPFGIVAHLCHYFFGPEWRPTTNRHLIGLPIPRGRP